MIEITHHVKIENGEETRNDYSIRVRLREASTFNSSRYEDMDNLTREHLVALHEKLAEVLKT